MRYLKLITLLTLSLLSMSAMAQEAAVPHYLNFQSVLRDDGGNLITDSFIDLEFKILDQDGQEIYHEVQPGVQVVRSAVNVMIGEGVDPNNPSVPKGGLPPSVLDPTNGQKFLQMKIGDNLPSDPMEFGMVPYAAWAEKALTVPNESIGSEQIKDGSIKVQDLAPELTFGDINGTASDGQIPTTIATDVELNAHINSTTAHPASAITVTGSFNFSSTPTAQAMLEGLDGGLASEVANRQLKDKEHKDTDIATAHPNGNFPTSRLSEQITNGQIADGAVNSSKIENGSILMEDLSSGGGGFGGWDQNASDDLTTSTAFGGDVSGTYNSISVADDSHNHTGSTISGLSTSDFSSANISQWTNDSGYLTTTTGDSRYVNVTGDTMTGSLDMGGNNIGNAGNFVTSAGVDINDHENRIATLEAEPGAPIAKAWVNWSVNGSGVITVISSFNVSGVANGGNSDFAVTFTSPMSDTLYMMAGSGEDPSDLGGGGAMMIGMNTSKNTANTAYIKAVDKNGNLQFNNRNYRVVFFR